MIMLKKEEEVVAAEFDIIGQSPVDNKERMIEAASLVTDTLMIMEDDELLDENLIKILRLSLFLQNAISVYLCQKM